MLLFAINNTTSTVFSQNTSPSLIAYWNFDNISNNTVPDNSGNNLIGYLYNTAIVPGINGSAVQFNGENSSMQVPNSPLLNLNNFSIIIWFDPVSTTTFARLIGKGSNTTESFGIYIDQTQPNRYMLYSGINQNLDGTGYFDFNNQWNQLCFVHTALTSSLYVNGQSVGTGSGPYAKVVNNVDPLVLGLELNPSINRYPFNGSIDEVEIYNESLTANYILTSYQALFNQPGSSQSSNSGISTSLTGFSSTGSSTNLATNSSTNATNNFLTGSNYLLNNIITIVSYGVLFGVIIVSAVVIFLYVNYRNNYKKRAKNNDKRSFRTFLFSFINNPGKRKINQSLSTETFDKINEIIEENKEKEN